MISELLPGVKVIFERNEVGMVVFNSITGNYECNAQEKDWAGFEAGVMIKLENGAKVFFSKEDFEGGVPLQIFK